MRGPLGVEERTLPALDAARKRTFTVTVWAPEQRDRGALPLIAYSHPSGGNRRSASFVARHLAARGYAVAALDHSETFAPELARDDDEDAARRNARIAGWIVNRVPDLRLLIDSVLLGKAGSDLTLDPARIGVMGHSFGGWTVLAAPDDDPRLGAVVAFAPAGGEPTPPGTIPVSLRFGWKRTTPLLLIAAEDDTSLPLAGMRELFGRAPQPKHFVVLPRTDHLHFMDDVERAHEAVRAMNPGGASAGSRMKPIDQLASGEETQRIVRALTLAHFDAALRGLDEAKAFLAAFRG